MDLPDGHPHLTSVRLRLDTFRPIEGEEQIIPPPLVGGGRGGGMLTELKCYVWRISSYCWIRLYELRMRLSKSFLRGICLYYLWEHIKDLFVFKLPH